MPRAIEGDGAKSPCLQLGHEQAETPGAAAPPVHEEHDRPAAPAPSGELVAIMRNVERLAGFEEGFLLRTQGMLRWPGEESLGEPRGTLRGERTDELEPEPEADDLRVNSTQRIRPRRLVGDARAHPATGPRSMTTNTMTTTATMSMTMPARSICRAVTRPDP